jgi:hypothetical protein
VATASGSTSGSTLYEPAATVTGQIGKSQFADPFFAGDIDDFRIYDTALSAVRVTQLADRSAPTVATSLDPADADGDDGWYVGPVSVSATASDAETGVAHLQFRTSAEQDWASYEGPIPVRDGEFEFEFRAVDDGGNSATSRVSVKRDATKPTVSAREGDGGVVVLEASDAVSGVAAIEYRTPDSEQWTIYESPVSASGQIAYRARDRAGNESDVATFEAVGTKSPVSVIPSARCVAGKVTALAKVSNAGEEPVSVTVTTPWGERSISTLAPDASSLLSFSTRTSAVAATEIESTTIGMNSTKTWTSQHSIPDFACGGVR